MNKSIIISIVLYFTFQAVYSQSLEQAQNVQYRISLKNYKKKFKKPLTSKDSLNFIYVNNDTLVVLKDYVRKPGRSVPYEYKDSTFLDVYKSIAFKYANDTLDKKSSMKYWKDDIAVYFSESVDKKVKKEFMSFAKNVVSQIDSLSIKEVKKVEDSNYIIYYNGDYEYESRMNKYTFSDYYMHWNNKNQIYKLFIKLNRDHFFNPTLRLKELKKYFIKSLGRFQFNKNIDCNNFFSGCYTTDYKLTDLDIEIIKYHYSYGICKGTNLETFENQHEKFKQALKNKKVLNSFYHEYE